MAVRGSFWGGSRHTHSNAASGAAMLETHFQGAQRLCQGHTSCSAILSESSERLRCRGRRPTAAQASATSASANGEAASDLPGLDPSDPSRAYASWAPMRMYGEATALSADTGDAGRWPPAGDAGG